MSLYYLDTSAALKLLVEESHSLAFAAFYDEHGNDNWVSSALLRIELVRAVTRIRPALLPEAHELLRAFGYVNIDDGIVRAAADEPDRGVRTPDAIHLATARVFGAELSAIATYDNRLSQACRDAGMSVVSPRG